MAHRVENGNVKLKQVIGKIFSGPQLMKTGERYGQVVRKWPEGKVRKTLKSPLSHQVEKEGGKGGDQEMPTGEDNRIEGITTPL